MKRIVLIVCSFLVYTSACADKFDFVALGDTAYNLPEDLPKYEALIQTINAAKPVFSIHVGDTWGALPCTEKNHRWILDWFNKYQQPVLYTPGDNEWTDCRKPELLMVYGKMLNKTATPAELKLLADVQSFDSAFERKSYVDSLLSLEVIRKVFFSEAKSLGQSKITVEQQSAQSMYKDMAENLRWMQSDVLFATVSVPGSDMNFSINDIAGATEAIERNKADVAWLQDTFAQAKKKDVKAVVIALHASMFVDGDGGDFSNNALRGGVGGPYYWVARAIRDLSADFAKPVLLINGDFHDLIIDRPFMVSQGEGKAPKYANITRLQVYGAPELKAVRVSVDTESKWVFSFSPLY